MVNYKKLGKIISLSYQLLKVKQPLLLSSATAFFSLFSMAPIIIIVINILSLYFKQEDLSTRLYDRLRVEFGADIAKQVQTIVNNFTEQASSVWLTIMGSIFLIFVSTTLFHIIHQALNYLWSIRLKSSAPFSYILMERSKSLMLIFAGGMLFVITFSADAAVGVLDEHLDQLMPAVNTLVIRIVSKIISILVVTLWFTMLFKYLPDANIKWKNALIGGIFTAILFSLGEYLLSRFLITENLNDIFGASASVMLLLLFVFYSSIIMYFGAAFTVTYAKEAGTGIKPKKHSESYRLSPAENELTSDRKATY